MTKFILLDEFHLTVYAPRGRPATEHEAVRQTLDDPGFQAAVRQAIRVVVRQFSALRKVRLTLTR